jgi:hypothetical protein
MLWEIFKELVSRYRLWQVRHRRSARMLSLLAILIAFQVGWFTFWWLVAFFGPGHQRHAVAGHVSWEGKPLDNGVIAFRPLDGQPFDSGALILNGSFSIPKHKGLTPGKYLVRIHSSIGDPKFPPPAPGERDTRPGVEILPARYNTSSELSAVIGAWGATRVTFELVP